MHPAIVCHPFTPAQLMWDMNTVSRPVLIFKVLRLLNSTFGVEVGCARDRLAGWSKGRVRTWRKRNAGTVGQHFNRDWTVIQRYTDAWVSPQENHFFVWMMGRRRGVG
ncbi:hypothetical protein NPIL_136391 [Nephila pilipes]|uniref:Uncharacterized protein n=1 Tax=Nephila pilipes TaxID=299642 RepID=A0A8X6UPL8_NEPPI|nr:hypothetical protein NPIL_136391 [Nephila pilipes]